MQGGTTPYPAAPGQQQSYPSQQAPQSVAEQSPVVQTAAPPPPVPPKNAPGNNKQIGNIEDEVLVPRTPDEEAEDGRVRIRDIWIYKQVRARQDEFTQYRPVRERTVFFCLRGLYNMSVNSIDT